MGIKITLDMRDGSHWTLERTHRGVDVHIVKDTIQPGTRYEKPGFDISFTLTHITDDMDDTEDLIQALRMLR